MPRRRRRPRPSRLRMRKTNTTRTSWNNRALCTVQEYVHASRALASIPTLRFRPCSDGFAFLFRATKLEHRNRLGQRPCLHAARACTNTLRCAHLPHQQIAQCEYVTSSQQCCNLLLLPHATQQRRNQLRAWHLCGARSDALTSRPISRADDSQTMTSTINPGEERARLAVES